MIHIEDVTLINQKELNVVCFRKYVVLRSVDVH